MNNKRVSIAVCAQIKVKANSKGTIEFSLVWHMPTISFTSNTIKYKKFYTRYFSSSSDETNNSNVAIDIAQYAHENKANWLKAIQNWQSPILNDK